MGSKTGLPSCCQKKKREKQKKEGTNYELSWGRDGSERTGKGEIE